MPATIPSSPHPQPKRMAGRAGTIGRWINFKFLDDNGFLFGQWIRGQGWEQFCRINILTYPRFVREFYRNLRWITRGITSFVKGVEFTLTELSQDRS